MHSKISNAVLYPNETIDVIGADLAYLTNNDGGRGKYETQDGNANAQVWEIETCSTNTVVVNTKIFKIKNLGPTRLILGWMGSSLS